jgi:uncharacterized protein (DUF433 family)
VASVAYPHIELNAEGVPYLAGTQTKVIEVALDRLAHHWDADEIQRQHPHLSLAQSHSALAYYYDHQPEMDQAIASALKRVEEIRAELGESPVRAKLKGVEAVSDLYSLLQHIHRRPSMYLRNKSLDEVEAACHWYAAALRTHGIEEFGSRFNERFRDYLYERFRWGMACGWARAIRDHSRSADAVFERFFSLLDEFKKCNT